MTTASEGSPRSLRTQRLALSWDPSKLSVGIPAPYAAPKFSPPAPWIVSHPGRSAVDGHDSQITSGMLLDDVRLLGGDPGEIFASALPGLMSFGGWSNLSNAAFTPATTAGSDRSRLTLGSPPEAAGVLGIWLSPPDTLPWRSDSV